MLRNRSADGRIPLDQTSGATPPWRSPRIQVGRFMILHLPIIEILHSRTGRDEVRSRSQYRTQFHMAFAVATRLAVDKF